MTRLFVNVDDNWIEREGVESAIRRLPDVDVENLTFAEACDRDSWEGVDYLAVDLSQVVDEDAAANEYPAVDVIRHAQSRTPGRGPHIVVITGDKGVYENAVIKRVLLELGARVFVHRDQLAERYEDIFAAGGPNYRQLEMKDEVASPLPGVDEHTKVVTVLDMARETGLDRKKIGGGVGQGLRTAITRVGRLKPVNAKGDADAGVVHRRQIDDLNKAATRIPRRTK